MPPIGPVESVEDRDKKKKKTKKKQVKFAEPALKQIGTKNQSIRTTTTQPTIKHSNTYFYPKKLHVPKEVKFLNKKKAYINKMYIYFYVGTQLLKKSRKSKSMIKIMSSRHGLKFKTEVL